MSVSDFLSVYLHVCEIRWLFYKSQGCSLLVIRALPLPTFSEESLMSTNAYMNFPQGQFSSQLTQNNMIHSDLKQYTKYQSRNLIFRTEIFKSFRL